MIRILLISLITFFHANAIETSESLFTCSKIFQERKAELLVELEKIDEQKQALEALKIATDELLRQKEQKIKKQEENLSKVLSQIEQKERSLKRLTEQNEKALEEMKSLKMNKTAQTFSKMKAASAASILEDMQIDDAARILMSLKPKTVGKILAKMSPQKASKITLKLAK